jgi:crossover junction endodeoxyribonuclease RusA
MVVSTEAREYREHVGWICRSAGVDMLSGDVTVVMSVYRPRKVGDLDNCIKIILDAMQGIVYENDKQVDYIIARRFEDKNEPRVEIEVSNT